MTFIKKYKYLITILVIGFTVRFIGLSNIPEGLNTDEASIGYDAFAIANYGIDRNGNFLPVFLKAWGSGQNALYAYLLVPIIKILGLSIFTVRLPMVLIGVSSIFIVYKLLLMTGNKKIALIGSGFLAICPWHIMKSRWGLESNLFPEMILFAIYFIELFIKNDKKYGLYIGFIFLGLSLYAYGTGYFVIPLLTLAILIYLVKIKKINIKDMIISIAILGIIAAPILICVIINTFDLPQINLPFMTIPRMTENRFEQASSIFSGEFIKSSLINLINSLSVIIMQTDGHRYNALNFFGTTYVFSLPFMIIGIVTHLRKRKITLIDLWFAVSLITLCVINEANINRINVIMFPCIIYTVFGILYVITKINEQWIITSFAMMYLIAFGLFLINYSDTKYDTLVDGFNAEIGEIVEYVSSLNTNDIYFEFGSKLNEDNAHKEYYAKEPYIYFLFYTKENPYEYIETVKYFREYGFENVKEYGKYHFYLPEEELPEEQKAEKIESEKKTIIIESKSHKSKFKEKAKKIKEFENFVVYEKE